MKKTEKILIHLTEQLKLNETQKAVLLKSQDLEVLKQELIKMFDQEVMAILNQALFREIIDDPQLLKLVDYLIITSDYDFEKLYQRFLFLTKDEINDKELIETLIRSANELMSEHEPRWGFVSASFLNYRINYLVNRKMKENKIDDFVQKVDYMVKHRYYGKYLIENYQEDQIRELGNYIDENRTSLMDYSGLDLIRKRYLVRSLENEVLETVQEMFMAIAMHLAMNEKEKVYYAKEIYDLLSTLKITMATPTLANARRPFHQLSSCFVDTINDSLEGIYKSISEFAQVSKYGGGMGLYLGKIRANGSDIRGYKGSAGGVIRWIKLINDTAIAVDQLGVRQGAVAVYLDAWHKDLPEFLSLKTNNGDDRMKSHDVFLGVCYPDLFWQKVKEDIHGTWFLMCPHEILITKGYALEDYYGKKWEEKYLECINDSRISKREIKLIDLVRLILKSAIETGSPFVFNRDHVNLMNPNAHQGMIYCSNLCSEIAQNMQGFEILEREIIEIEGEKIVVEKSKAKDYVVCNLASLALGNIEVDDLKQLEHIISVTIRALDNVIDLNYYPTPYAKITNQNYRSIGLGVSGYHHLLAKKQIAFESEEHLTYIDELFENINYFALKASNQLAKEKGSYAYFKGSDYESGAYFTKRQYKSERFMKLAKKIQKGGLRNGYLLAIAPTSSTSIIANTTASVDPILDKFYYEEKKGSMLARVVPDLNMNTFWYYKNAHYMDQSWLIKAAAIRQRHIDQSQSLNLYITNEDTFSKILKLYLLANDLGVKTIYYIKSQSLEVEECVSCAS